jgi:hypothetical protein
LEPGDKRASTLEGEPREIIVSWRLTMSEGAWTVIGVLVGGIIVGAANYVLQWQKRNWEIADERRKVRQERLKQARQHVEDMASWTGKCVYGDTFFSEVPGDVVGNVLVTMKYLSEKHGHALDEDRIGKVRWLTKARPGEEDGAPVLDICGELLMWIDQAMEATFE